MSLPYLCPPCRRNVLRKLYSLRRLNRIPQDHHGSYATLTTSVPEHQRTPLESSGPNDVELLPTKPPRAVLTTSNNPYSANGIGRDRWSTERGQKEDLVVLRPGKPPTRSSELAFGGWFATPHQLVTDSLDTDYRRRGKKSQSLESSEESLSVRFEEILRNRACTTLDAWRYFEHVYNRWDCRALSCPTFLDLTKIRDGAVFKRLLWAILDDWIQGKLEPGLPTPRELIERFASLGILHPSALCAAIGELNIVLLKSFACETPKAQHISAEEIMSDVMELWAMCFELAGWKSHVQLKECLEMWSVLPGAVPESFDKSGTSSSYFISRLIEHLPGIPRNLASGLAMHALITLDLLLRKDNPLHLTEETRTKHQPFADFLFRLLPLAAIRILKDMMEHVLATQDITTEEISKILANIESYHLVSMSFVETSGKELDENGNEVSKAELLEKFFMARIRRALVDEQSYTRVHHLWQEARMLFSGGRQDSGALGVPAPICNLAIEALTALRQPEKAVAVWNEMVDSGIAPTIKTWTGILNGCRKARDVEGLEEVWERMISAGVEPDEMAWTTRITGLMEGKRPDKAMIALERMGKNWIAAVNRPESSEPTADDSNDTMPIKPTIGMLNGVITSITKSAKDSDIPKSKIWPLVNRALKWGQSLGISPDVVTFNAIISLCLNRGDNESAMFYLQQMERNGVYPDLATFSVILIWMFRGRAVATGAGLEIADIEDILNQLNKRGLTPNRYTYGIIIDGLLNSQSTAAANAVLDYMSDHKVPLHPHIYTTFMNHFFRRRDLASVDSLWNRIERQAPYLDIVFYDCMIKNYARLKDIGKMMTFVMRMSKHGQTPSWEAMTLVVKTLAEAEDWDRFDRVVEDMRTESGIANQGLRLTREAVRAKFWRTVYTLDACRPPEKQIWNSLHDVKTYTQYGREMTPMA
ncbi:hypothetical protein IWX90DRAFT_422092 [Phyllosticta citrichinensis]|uniref:Pentatricopeptide repeat domain-containing protein n=1 Tax=Phyllosticta citrichinensis TaxID=1130410 RepID=A0ABR1Y7F5_9PEZI